jgi:predicted DNA-binding transcriptional regulator YafY
MLETSARLLRLLSLLQARRDWSGHELAARLEVDVRTIRRDVDRLRDLGYRVQASSGVGGGYQFGAGASMPPLLLDDDEAVAVTVALRSAAGSAVRLEETAMRVLAKIDQILPPRLRPRLNALHSVTVSLERAAEPLDPEMLTTVAVACRDRVYLRFRYRDRGGKKTARVVEPVRLAHTGRRWYLAAWDCGRSDWRTFRMDRLLPPLSTGRRFLPREPPDGDIAAYVQRSISYAPYRFRARLALEGSAASLANRIPPWLGILEAVDEKSCVLSTGGDSLEMLVAQMVMTGVDFELLEPSDLGPSLRRIAAKLRRATQRSSRSRQDVDPSSVRARSGAVAT